MTSFGEKVPIAICFLAAMLPLSVFFIPWETHAPTDASGALNIGDKLIFGEPPQEWMSFPAEGDVIACYYNESTCQWCVERLEHGGYKLVSSSEGGCER